LLVALVAGVGGYLVRGLVADARRPEAAFVTTAIGAHTVYVPEVRHPVEVSAAEETHLVQWLTKRIGADVRAPALAVLGWKLIGGRLLPDQGLPAAQFMYEDATGRRLTLYIRKEGGLNDTSFRFAERDGFGAFYWIDRPLAYAVAGRLGREELMSLANAVYAQLDALGVAKEPDTLRRPP
jgi:anti-sigma factor RsiW